jgi:Ni/Fe-hydrogenase subunit HybB-like protein
MALLVVLYIVVNRLRKKPIDTDLLGSLVRWLGGFLTAALFLEALEVISMLYESEESWGILSVLITEKLRFSYLEIQLGLGSLLPFLLLAALAIFKIQDKLRIGLTFMAGILVLVGVFAMRWNVVIGGQLFSKSLEGFKSYTPHLLGMEGIVITAGLMALPFLILAIFCYFFPPWLEESTLAREKVGPRISWGSSAK